MDAQQDKQDMQDRRSTSWSRSIFADVAVAVAALTAALSLPLPTDEQVVAPLTPAVAVLTIIGGAALVVRRRCPWLVWSFLFVLMCVGVVLDGTESRTQIPAVVSTYTVCSATPLGKALTAAALSAIVPVILIMSVGQTEASPPFGMTLVMVPWFGFAAVSGIAVRYQRAVVLSARDRARQAEETREEEAHRRVTEERLRIARDLHDVLAHQISVINIQAGVAGLTLRSDPDAAEDALRHVREASRFVLREVPALVRVLRRDGSAPVAPARRLGELGDLVTAFRENGIAVAWQSTGDLSNVPPHIDVIAYRVAQEALTNAGKHGSGPVDLSVDVGQTTCTVLVRNALPIMPAGATVPGNARQGATGHGAVPQNSGHGLLGMRERVDSVSGYLDVGPEPPNHWKVLARLDLGRATSPPFVTTAELDTATATAPKDPP